MTLPDTATTTVGVLTAMTFSASGAAPTPLHEQYQANLGQTCACKACVLGGLWQRHEKENSALHEKAIVVNRP
jgi:hypothetical protein